MRKTLIASALAAISAVPALALAADAAPYTITTNVNLVSDYYFRGITQTWHKPAIQGGADFTHNNGLYAGVWASNVSNNQYPGGSGLEFDYYGGYNGKINDDIGYTVGGHGYYYPGANVNKAAGAPANPSQKYDSFELNVGANWKFVSVKYSYFLTDWFGANSTAFPASFSGNSKGTGYLELNVAYEFLPTWTLNVHAAQTKVKGVAAGAADPSYNDYSIGVAKTFDGGWSVGLGYYQSKYKNNDAWKPAGGYASLANTDTIKDPGEGRLILTVGRTF